MLKELLQAKNSFFCLLSSQFTTFNGHPQKSRHCTVILDRSLFYQRHSLIWTHKFSTKWCYFGDVGVKKSLGILPTSISISKVSLGVH